MSQSTAIVVAAVIAVAGYIINHALGRRTDRKRAEEQAVADLAGAAMVFAQVARFNESLKSAPAWRQLAFRVGRGTPEGFAFQLAYRSLDGLDELVRAHGALLQHARAKLADAAGDVLDACLAVGEAWVDPDAEVVRDPHHHLGQARLRLFEVSRGRRSGRWRLGRPAVFDSIANEGAPGE